MFYKNELAENTEHKYMYRIVKMILILSHGNSEVERGFSVNKQLLKENQHERFDFDLSTFGPSSYSQGWQEAPGHECR